MQRFLIAVSLFSWLLLHAAGSPSARAESAEGESIAIASIEIEGAEGKEALIRAQMRLKPGETYTPDEFQAQLNADIHHLFRWGVLVRSVRPRAPRGETHLVLEVETRLKVASIEFEGLDHFEREEILPLLLVKSGAPTDRALLELAVDQLKEQYRNAGYRFASIDFTLKPLPQDRVHLVFTVHEGPRTKIDDIVFVGNLSIRPGRLRSVMETKRSDLFQAERLEDATLRRDLAAVEQFYREEGWRDAEASLEDVVYSEDREEMVIVIRVKEGERYVVESVAVEGNQALSTAALEKLIELRPGLPYRAAVIYGDLQREEKGDFKRIREAYGELGYLEPVLQAGETFDDGNKTVRVVYRIREGDKFRVRRVVVRGNEKTRDDVVRRHLVIRPGEVPKLSEIEASYMRLQQSQYFSKIDLRFPPTGDPESRDLLFEVEEGRTGDIRFVAAYNQSTQFQGQVALRLRNFDIARLPRSVSDLLSGRAFAGGGQTLTLQVSAGGDRQVIYNLKFEEPYFFGTRTLFTLNLFRFQRDWGPYLEQRLAGNIMFGRRLTSWLTARLTYRLEALELRDISEYAPPDVFAARGPDTISGLQGELSFDFTERDAFGQPYAGMDATLSYEYTGGILQGTIDIHKAEIASHVYTTLFGKVSEWRQILKVWGFAGWCDTHHHAEQVPIYERFYLGGLLPASPLRGFEYRSIGPRQLGEPVGGDFLVAGGVEYSLPVYRAPMPGTWQQEIDVLRLVFFYDVGMLVPNERLYASRHFRSGVGFGFRLRVPALGGIPIALDFGWPISRRPEDRTERVSFSLGFFFF